MLLHRGLEDFPETAGKNDMLCCGCQEPLHPSEAVSVNQLRDNPLKAGGQQLMQFLVCYSCTLSRCEHLGRC